MSISLQSMLERDSFRVVVGRFPTPEEERIELACRRVEEEYETGDMDAALVAEVHFEALIRDREDVANWRRRAYHTW